MPQLATGEWVGAWALTEPGSGSDAAALARRGPNAMATAGGSTAKDVHHERRTAQVFVVMARTDASTARPKGISAFIVERDTPGLTIGPKEDKLGMRASDTVPLDLEDVYCGRRRSWWAS